MAHLSGNQIGKYAGVLALTLLVGTAVLSLSTREAEAALREDTVVRCAQDMPDGSIKLYRPDDVTWTTGGGKASLCTASGSWS
jgi:hypothetical protein